MATTTAHGLLTLSSEIKNNPINVDPIKGQNYDCHTISSFHPQCTFFQEIWEWNWIKVLIIQSLPLGVPDERLKLRVTIDQKFRENIRLSQAVSVCQSQLTPPAKVPSSPTCSSVKVSVVSAGYDTIIKTQLVIHVGEKMQRVICKDGRVLNFSYEPQELTHYLLLSIQYSLILIRVAPNNPGQVWRIQFKFLVQRKGKKITKSRI